MPLTELAGKGQGLRCGGEKQFRLRSLQEALASPEHGAMQKTSRECSQSPADPSGTNKAPNLLCKMKVLCSRGPQTSLLLALSGCNPSLSSRFYFSPPLPSPEICLLFLLTSFCRSRLRQAVCCLPDAKMDYWINSSVGCSASQRLEVREVINSPTAPFAHCEGAGAIDFADSLGSCSRITACISVGNKSTDVFQCLLLSSEKETYAVL